MDDSDSGLKVDEAITSGSDTRYVPVENNRDDVDAQHGSNASLFPKDKCSELDNDWQQIQVGFVDEPRAAVEKADALVKRTIDDLAASFSDVRATLETSWERDKEVSTEDLRRALQSYRSFFKRLLSI